MTSEERKIQDWIFRRAFRREYQALRDLEESRREHLHTQEHFNKFRQEHQKCREQLKSE